MGKVSDALEKLKEQTIPADNKRLVGIETSKREDVKTNSLSSHAPRKIGINQLGDRENSESGRHKINQLPVSEKLESVVEQNKSSYPLFDENKADRNLVTYFLPHSYEAEQFRMLRSNILFPKNGKPPRSILITSTTPSEGKSFVAANLSISIAQNIDKHVLLIDCDMRKPSINGLFGFGSVPGLSDYLTSGHSLSSLLQKTCIERLSVLPGGPPPVNPAELLSSGRMVDLLKEVSQRYNDRFIIIDSPPLQLTAEAKVLAKFTHAVLLVARFGRTDKKMALEMINKIGVEKIVGVVGNFIDRKSIKKNYSDKYQGYYGGYIKARSRLE